LDPRAAIARAGAPTDRTGISAASLTTCSSKRIVSPVRGRAHGITACRIPHVGQTTYGDGAWSSVRYSKMSRCRQRFRWVSYALRPAAPQVEHSNVPPARNRGVREWWTITCRSRPGPHTTAPAVGVPHPGASGASGRHPGGAAPLRSVPPHGQPRTHRTGVRTRGPSTLPHRGV